MAQIGEIVKVNNDLSTVTLKDGNDLQNFAFTPEMEDAMTQLYIDKVYKVKAQTVRKITHLVLHCTATQPTATVTSIQRYWRESLKWKSPGYHYLIEASGKVHNLQPEDKPSNGVAGHNANSIHISYIGGIDAQGKPKDTRTPAQIAAQIKLLKELRGKYPKAVILGHRDFKGVAKACPSFDVAAWLKTVGL